MAAPAHVPYSIGNQDRPPLMPETIKYTRYYPRRGPSGAVVFITMFVSMGVGFYYVGLNNHERHELNREKAWNRISLIPLLQAEADRDHVLFPLFTVYSLVLSFLRTERKTTNQVRRLASSRAKESAIMEKSHSNGDWAALDLKTPVKGIARYGAYDESKQHATPVYYTNRYVRPSFVFIPPDSGEVIPPQWWRGTRIFTLNPPYHKR
ncbi:hypothetical protein HDU82_003246 [Entophlyctis luteolus]|nr:hypothetical protein HDU82_003246 [Entophlyctis luteolus]